MAFPELLDALRQQAAAQREEELARAEADAERIRAEAHVALERRRADYLERARLEEAERARRAVARAQKEAIETVLGARDRLLARVATALRARADDALQDPEYRGSLTHEVREGLDRLPPGPVVVRTHPELAELVRQAAEGREGVVIEATESVGAGFRALAADIGVEVDGTLATRLEQEWSRVAVSVLREAAK